MIPSDLERYDVGLLGYVKLTRNIHGFQSKQFWAQLPHFPCSISSSILLVFNMILTDLERYNVGLLEYVINLGNMDNSVK